MRTIGESWRNPPSNFHYDDPKEKASEMRANLIKSDPSVMMGKPVVSGTGVTVELVLEKLTAGESIEQIIEAHPGLTVDAV